MPKKRIGKTEKDRNSGATARRFSNREARTAWQHDSNSRNSGFPRLSCNGKKNRSRITGKKNTVVFV